MRKLIVLIVIPATIGVWLHLSEEPIVGGGSSSLEKNNEGIPSLVQRCANREDEAYRVSQQFVLKNIKAPSTAEFLPKPDSSKNTEECLYTVWSKFDSQNAYGAMLRTTYVAKVHYQPRGKNWMIESLHFDEKDDALGVAKD